MSQYRGRAGPNFSEYLNSLNTNYEPTFAEDVLNNQDLSMFTDTDFTSMDDSNFNFELPAEVNTFHGGVTSQSPVESTHNLYSSYNTPIQPAPAQPSAALSPTESLTPTSAIQRKNQDVAPPITSEERSRLAAEEDKRRRNTAASARFRVKKKQREQALEKNLKDAQDKISKQDAQISQLEMENKWLKDLITEKNGISSKEEMAAAYQKYRKESEEREVKAEAAHTTGVGTD